MNKACYRWALVCFFLTQLCGLSGCGGYDEVSPDTYEYAKALYSICNRRASDKLEEVRGAIELARQNDRITERESDWLVDILADAESGKWEAASRAARQMMEDQVHEITERNDAASEP